jgi:hypothetical protein
VLAHVPGAITSGSLRWLQPAGAARTAAKNITGWPPPTFSLALIATQVRPAIEDCARAGIRVVVITGDNKLTAEAICRKIGVFEDGVLLARRSMTGISFAALPEAEKREILAQKVRHLVDQLLQAVQPCWRMLCPQLPFS